MRGRRATVTAMSHPSWPLLDLRLSTPDLELRPATEADQLALAALLPDDVELDPDATTYAVEARAGRAAVVLQGLWKALGTWRPDAWQLDLAVRAGGELIGVQTLEGTDFPRLRTVDSASWLATPTRGRGLGKQMRRAVLALAFGPLRAEAAVTSAWPDNHGSLGVSRALGYRPNGERRHRRGEGVDTMVHLLLTRSDWLAGGGADGVRVTGVEACLPFFGLAAEVAG